MNYFWTVNLKTRDLFIFALETPLQAICFLNAFFKGQPYELGRTLEQSYKHLFMKSKINLSDKAKDFVDEVFNSSKKYCPPVGSIVFNKMITGEFSISSDSPKSTRRSKK